MLVSSVSFAYPGVDGAIRADLTRRLAGGEILSDTFLLSTCLRIELAVPGDADRLERAVKSALGDPSLLSHGEVRRGEDAVHHLYRVAAGLESPILGEREILTQFRQALGHAEEAGLVGGLLGKVLEGAVSAGRQARELLPDSPHASLAAVAAQVVGAHPRVAVFGAGLMGRSVIHGLVGLPAPPEIVVVARSPENVSVDGGAEVWPFDRAGEALATFPAVVSATSAKRRLVTDDGLAATVASRTQPLLLVDMAMPPDFSPPDGAAVHYVDIDDLANMASRRPRGDEAAEMVAAAAADMYRRVGDHHSIGPVIGGLMRSADEVVANAVGRFQGRLMNQDDHAVLRQTAHTVARTLLAGPAAYLKSPDRPSDAVDIIADAFGLQDD